MELLYMYVHAENLREGGEESKVRERKSHGRVTFKGINLFRE